MTARVCYKTKGEITMTKQIINLPFLEDRMELIIPDGCEIVNEEGKWILVSSQAYQKLQECRAAYLETIGDWRFDMIDYVDSIYTTHPQKIYYICYDGDEITIEQGIFGEFIFPNKEMCEKFYETYKKLLYECMSFL
jgi:hypothetical protein